MTTVHTKKSLSILENFIGRVDWEILVVDRQERPQCWWWKQWVDSKPLNIVMCLKLQTKWLIVFPKDFSVTLLECSLSLNNRDMYPSFQWLSNLEYKIHGIFCNHTTQRRKRSSVKDVFNNKMTSSPNIVEMLASELSHCYEEVRMRGYEWVQFKAKVFSLSELKTSPQMPHVVGSRDFAGSPFFDDFNYSLKKYNNIESYNSHN
jgi:hypothetical protein